MTNNTDPAGLSSYPQERPVPTTDEPKRQPGFWATHVEDPVTGAITNEDGSPYVAPSLPPPTREQIAEAITWAWKEHGESDRLDLDMADVVLALIQNGADR